MSTTMRGAAAPTSQGADRGEVDAAALDAVVVAVAGAAERWAATSAAQRATLLRAVIDSTLAAAPSWLAAACEAKGLDPQSGEAGEELFSGVGTFVRMARTLAESLEQIATAGRPQFPGPVREATDGRLIVGVFPADRWDKVLQRGVTGEVWIEPGVTRAELEADQAPAYRDPGAFAGLSLVLGAGNVASLGPRDVLSKLFVEGKVVVLKANPVNDYLVSHWAAAMAPLIEQGFLAIVDGGAAVGAHLCAHNLVDEIHVTGSDKTHDAIVYGTGDEGARRKAADERLITKPVTCELGNVSPVIIVPGNWSAADLRYQATHVATMLVNNAGFNCLTPRVLVTWAGWDQRDAFLHELSNVLSEIPQRRAYYPGAADRRGQFMSAHPEALELGAARDDSLPWTLIEDVDPETAGEICFNVEAFCSLTSETALMADDEASFVDAAVSFCNDEVWGTLSATVLAHPDSLGDPTVGPRIEAALENLRYGGIGLNLWHAFCFALSVTSWGAYPGHPATDIQSGSGVVGNAFMLTHIEKSIVRGPWRAKPTPAWFATAKNQKATMERLLAFEASPSVAKLPALLLAALRN
jgi:hypothetical protein